MTTQDATHAPAGTGEETAAFEAASSPLLFDGAPSSPLEVTVLPSPLEDAPPMFEGALLLPSLEVVATPSLETTPTPAAALAATPEPARRVKQDAAPDPFAVGVRLLRMAPAWLLLTTFGCALLVLLLGWMKAGGDVSAVTLPAKQNDARAVKTTPKADAAAPKTAAANSPDVATPPAEAPRAAAAPAPNNTPAPTAAQPAPTAPTEQPSQPAPAAAPKAAERAQAEQTAPADNAGAKFTVQVGSYNNQSEANAHVSRLRAAGFESRAAAVELPGRGTWYRVQVGRFAERAEATKAAGQLHSKGAAAGAIVAPLQD